MKTIRTFLSGLGNVNIGLLKILTEKEHLIAREHKLELSIVGVADSSGVAVNDAGYSYQELIELKARGGGASKLDGYLPSVATAQIVESMEADLLVEGSPVNLKTGNPGLQAMRNALTRGWSVVSANKAPLVLAFDELHSLTEKYGGKLAYSAAVCGGLPIINVLQRDLKATELIGLQGVFNATTNFILEELEHGGSFGRAVREAQRIGAAETDPALDVEGFDTANKLYIIMKSFTDFSGILSDIHIEGIRGIDTDAIRMASDKNRRLKLIAAAERHENGWALSVRPTEVETGSFLGSCDGWEMGIQLQTDYYEDLAMKIREEEPVSTCAAVLRDIINISCSK
jgi:homoserine dehydrogenase